MSQDSTDVSNWPKLRIGISSCLIGNRVRHNGEHRGNDWLLHQLGPFVSWVPICPEVEMGLGVPRETLRLVGSAEDLHLVTAKTQIDHTGKAHETIERLLEEDLKLDAYIFKKDSPSCGLERVKVYGPSGIPAKKGVGLFAAAVQKRYPQIPMIEEGRLSDSQQQEVFLIKLYMWSRFSRTPRTISDLQTFHRIQKLQLMAYDPSGYHKLGRVAANSTTDPVDVVFEAYATLLSILLNKNLTIEKYVNVFQHMLGYFKKSLESSDKAYLLKLLDDYGNRRIPLVSISTLFGYLVKRYAIHYLADQSILSPFPNGIIIGGE